MNLDSATKFALQSFMQSYLTLSTLGNERDAKESLPKKNIASMLDRPKQTDIGIPINKNINKAVNKKIDVIIFCSF